MRLLDHLVQRMYGALTAGPALNCRPHRSRQRIDLDLVARLDGATPASILSGLLSSHPRLTIDAIQSPGLNEMSQACHPSRFARFQAGYSVDIDQLKDARTRADPR